MQVWVDRSCFDHVPSSSLWVDDEIMFRPSRMDKSGLCKHIIFSRHIGLVPIMVGQTLSSYGTNSLHYGH